MCDEGDQFGVIKTNRTAAGTKVWGSCFTPYFFQSYFHRSLDPTPAQSPAQSPPSPNFKSPYQISFDIDQNLCDKVSEDKSQCPSNHDMRLGTLAGPNRALAVYSEGEEVS
eukprot:sb/3477221/